MKFVCKDRDFDMEIGPRFCNRGFAKSRSSSFDCMYKRNGRASATILYTASVLFACTVLVYW